MSSIDVLRLRFGDRVNVYEYWMTLTNITDLRGVRSFASTLSLFLI